MSKQTGIKVTLKASDMVEDMRVFIEKGETLSNLEENHIIPIQEELSAIDVVSHELLEALKNLIQLVDNCIEDKECNPLVTNHYTYLNAHTAIKNAERGS